MARKQQGNAPAPAAQPAYKVVKREKDRWWEVRDPGGALVCLTVYKHGAGRGEVSHGCCGVGWIGIIPASLKPRLFRNLLRRLNHFESLARS